MGKICTVCGAPAVARGWCNKHYLRWRMHGSPIGGAPERSRAPVVERFWSWVAVGAPDDCWPHGGRPRGSSGHVGFQAFGRGHYAHRFAWEMTSGPVPDGLEVCHSCDNPPCCNPAHLFLGTHQDNMDDMARKLRYRVLPQPGESNPMAKLTAVQVVEIRAEYATGAWSQSDLGRRYGVSRPLISLIVNRKAWTTV